MDLDFGNVHTPHILESTSFQIPDSPHVRSIDVGRSPSEEPGRIIVVLQINENSDV